MAPTVAKRSELRVAVVGPCASGKSTLVAALCHLGFDAYNCGQEHSEVPTLWQHGEPALVVFLDVDLETTRRRRGSDWPEDLFRRQLDRLEGARAAAHVVIDARSATPDDVLATTVAALDAHIIANQTKHSAR